MGQIHFDEAGSIKVQEMSHVFFNQFKVNPQDLIYMPLDVLCDACPSNKGDVWTLGMILLICMSLEFDLDYGKETKDRIIAAL